MTNTTPTPHERRSSDLARRFAVQVIAGFVTADTSRRAYEQASAAINSIYSMSDLNLGNPAPYIQALHLDELHDLALEAACLALS